MFSSYDQSEIHAFLLCRLWPYRVIRHQHLRVFTNTCYPPFVEMGGAGFRGLREEQRVLKNDFHKRGTRAMFLKAFANEKEVEILEGQSSAMMHTYAISNALVYIPWDKEFSKAGEEVAVYYLD